MSMREVTVSRVFVELQAENENYRRRRRSAVEEVMLKLKLSSEVVQSLTCST